MTKNIWRLPRAEPIEKANASMQDSIDRCATFGWTKFVDWDKYAAELDHNAPEPKSRKVIPKHGRWGIGLSILPTPTIGCGIRAIDHHMKHSPSAKRDYGKFGQNKSKKNKRSDQRERDTKNERRRKKHGKSRKKVGVVKNYANDKKHRHMENGQKHQKKYKNRRGKLLVDDLSRCARHDSNHRVRNHTIQCPPNLQARISLSALSLDPSKVEIVNKQLAVIGFSSISTHQPPSPPLRCYEGPLTSLVAATKYLGHAFLPYLKPQTVSDDFEVLSRAFPEHCNILNEKSTVSSISIFRHASSDHQRARPNVMLRCADGSTSHVPLILSPDLDRDGVPKPGLILARSFSADVVAAAAGAAEAGAERQQGQLMRPFKKSGHYKPHTMLHQIIGPTPQMEHNPLKLGNHARVRIQLRIGRGASTNPLVGLRSPAMSYCRLSRPKRGLENGVAVQHTRCWGYNQLN